MQEAQEMSVQALGQEDLPEEETATHSSILAWKTPWTEEPGELQHMGSQRVGHDGATKHACFSMALELRIVFAFSKDWGKNQKKNHILWHMKILWNSSFMSINEALLERGHAHSFIDCLQCFHIAKVVE